MAVCGSYTGKTQWKIWGKLKIKEAFKDGKYNGEQFTYYDNGQIQSKATFENGVAVGTFYEYYKNGAVAYTGNFINGKRLPTLSFWIIC